MGRMEVVHQHDTLPVGTMAATIGMFDGVHLGHRHILSYLCRYAGEHGLRSMVVTFENHPRTVLRPDAPFLTLMTPRQRLEALSETGVDATLLLHFDEHLASLSSQEFMRLLHDRYGVALLLVGYDHRFGHDRDATFSDYVEYGRQAGIEVVRIPEFHSPLGRISSSRIRELLMEGRVEDAGRMLSRPYRLCGKVEKGLQIGRTIGFPTANIAPGAGLVVPGRGVYAVRVLLPDGRRCGGMLNIGVRPTFGGETKESIEVNIFDFNDDIYGDGLSVDFVAKLRDERKMSSADALRAQLAVDREQALDILKSKDL